MSTRKTITIYNMDAQPLTAPYLQFYSQSRGVVYDPTNTDVPFPSLDSAEFADTVIALTKKDIVNAWIADVPALPNGEWHLIVRDCAGTPDAGDLVVDFAKFTLSNSEFVHTPDLLGELK
jgi:hypothetical protein